MCNDRPHALLKRLSKGKLLGEKVEVQISCFEIKTTS
jgi:hypothetical protein